VGYFDNKNNVEAYMRMSEGFDGRELIEVLKNYLEPGSTVLELGMGPGRDLDILNETYKATGSDNSAVFLDLYREENPDADLLFLDAVTLDTERKFNCIYSNKVLHHLKREELEKSLLGQYDLLKEDGLLFHTFWYGEKEEFIDGLRFQYYTEDALKLCTGEGYKEIKSVRYTEMEDNDSLYLILSKI
jgi:SAM-dependent methyltransferase